MKTIAKIICYLVGHDWDWGHKNGAMVVCLRCGASADGLYGYHYGESIADLGGVA